MINERAEHVKHLLVHALTLLIVVQQAICGTAVSFTVAHRTTRYICWQPLKVLPGFSRCCCCNLVACLLNISEPHCPAFLW